MARYGYGLLLVSIRASYHLGTGALGLIAAGGYAAYLVSSTAAVALVPRIGARSVVVAGGVCATLGMAAAGLTRTSAGLCLSVLVAGASAGLVFPPFSDIVAGDVAPAQQGRTLAAISSGTGWGVAIAAPVAILLGDNWRPAWLIWAGLAAVITIACAWMLPSGRGPARAALPTLRPAWFVCPRSGPLLTGALLIGLGASVFWTFAVDLLQSSGGLRQGASRGFLMAVGVASVAGTLAADLCGRIGPRRAFALTACAMAASLAVLALWPASLPTALVAGAGFGAAYNAVVALQTLWSAEVFAGRPSAGLAAVMMMLGVGQLIGPSLAGAAAGVMGLRGAFFAAATMVALSATLLPRHERLTPALSNR
jgi:predicted MFS family arabinose efflux permease